MHYRHIAPKEIFRWQDVNECPDELAATGISLSQGLRLLHAKDASGAMHVGVDAFILIWQQLNRWRVLAVFIALPVVRQISDLVYRLFAHWRFKRLKHCQLAARQDTPS